ncbi:MAG TPA: DUF2267 domain-containing protein [Solirubrobacteraceae bacterium]|nr:DUF2267 domain-containing protein [Solirubrobacteraceae bacterium]
MDYETFLTVVDQVIGTEDGPGPDPRAIRATRATLQTLGERIDRGQARRLAAELPPEIAPWIATPTPAEGFDVDEFVDRVAAREGVDPITASRHVAAVFTALAQAISDREYAGLVAELPRRFAALLPRGPHVPVVDPDTFRRQVAARAGIGLDAADRATDAVLEVLGQRIAGGEVDDLIERLPVTLHPPLKRGRAEVRGEPKPMELGEFIRAVADRERVGIVEAALHVRAVLTVLRDMVGEDEFRDITVQLPDDYLAILR